MNYTDLKITITFGLNPEHNDYGFLVQYLNEKPIFCRYIDEVENVVESLWIKHKAESDKQVRESAVFSAIHL